MTGERIVFNVAAVLLLIFIYKRYLLTEYWGYLAVLCGQVFAETINILVIYHGILSLSITVQIVTVLLTILIPGIVFLVEYSNKSVIAWMYFVWGKILALMRAYTPAVRYLKKTVLLDSHSYSAYCSLARIYSRLEENRNALEAYEKAVRLKKNDYKTLYNVGVLLSRMDKKEEAASALYSALKIRPGFVPGYDVLGRILSALERYDEAVKVYKSGFKYANKNPEFHYQAGLAYLKSGNVEGALQEFETAVQLKRMFHQAHYELARVYISSKEYEKALASLEYALNYKPEYLGEVRKDPAFADVLDREDFAQILGKQDIPVKEQSE